MHVSCHNYVITQRKQEYNDLLHTLQVTRMIDEKSPKFQVFLEMWKIVNNELTFDASIKNNSASSFVAIVKCLIHFFDDDIDIFWIARKFYDNVLNMKGDIPRLIEVTHNLLEKEDPEFYKTLKANSVLDNLPLAKWFDCCFAGIFNENCIIRFVGAGGIMPLIYLNKANFRIWDKICGGSYKILAYLVTFSLTTLRHRIIKMTDVASITQCIKNVS